LRTNNIKNVLLITSSYPPEIRSSSHLMQEMAESLKDRGHRVFVVTSYPHHNLADGHNNQRFNIITDENGIQVLRIKTIPAHMVGYLIRGFSQLILPYLFLYKIKRLIKVKIDIVIVYSPPLPLAIVGEKLKEHSRAKYILNVQDLFPQNAIDLGILKNRFLIDFFERIEANAYTSADHIVVHSENNGIFLNKKKEVPYEKVNVIHNWIDIAPYKHIKKTGRFRKIYGIQDKFIFLFAGVLGPSQGLELIIKAADQLKKFPEICFLIVGDGTEKNKLVRMAEEYGLTNICFRPFVSKEEYPELVKDADVGLVCLSSMNKTPVVPGKILGYMAASIPVVAFLNKESDGHKVIEDAQCGFTSVSDDPTTASGVILKIYKDRVHIKKYGEKGFKYVCETFDKEICLNKLEILFRE